jgi:hypothetical protein
VSNTLSWLANYRLEVDSGVACLPIGSAAVNNVRRIQRYLLPKAQAKTAQPMVPDA